MSLLLPQDEYVHFLMHLIVKLCKYDIHKDPAPSKVQKSIKKFL